MEDVDVAKELKTIRATADLPEVMESDMEGDLVKLANDAKDFLGYKPLHKKVVSTGSNRLANTLIELGIEVLDPAAILKYQAKLGRPNGHLVRLVQEGLVEGDDEGDEEPDDDEVEERAPRQWGRIELEHYRKAIPAHVLQKAVDIKLALPTAEFTVEEIRRAQDPFLIVSFQDEQFYIDVWEEPTFESDREQSRLRPVKAKRQKKVQD